MPQYLDNERNTQLRLAAEALVEWIQRRRTTWSDDEDYQAEAFDAYEAQEPPRIPVAEDLGEFSEFGEAADALVDTQPRPYYPSPEFSPVPVLAPPPPPPAPPAPPPAAFASPVIEEIGEVEEASPTFSPAATPHVDEEYEHAAFDRDAMLEAAPAPPVPATKKRSSKEGVPAAAMLSKLAPVAELARKVGPIAAVLLLVIGIGWMARPYVVQLQTMLNTPSEKTPAPDPEPVAKKTAPPASKGAGGPTGQLITRSEPAGATVLVDGKERGVTPLTLNDLTVGSHVVVLQSDKGSVRRSVDVSAERAVVVSESIFAGWLNVFAPFDLQITEGTHLIRLDESGKVLLPPGSHELHLENRELGFNETRRVEVQPGQTASLSIVAMPSTLTVTATVPATVSIDGQAAGETPLTDHPIALGTRDIVVKAADGAERHFTQRVTVAPVQINVDFSQP